MYRSKRVTAGLLTALLLVAGVGLAAPSGADTMNPVGPGSGISTIGCNSSTHVPTFKISLGGANRQNIGAMVYKYKYIGSQWVRTYEDRWLSGFTPSTGIARKTWTWVGSPEPGYFQYYVVYYWQRLDNSQWVTAGAWAYYDQSVYDPATGMTWVLGGEPWYCTL